MTHSAPAAAPGRRAWRTRQRGHEAEGGDRAEAHGCLLVSGGRGEYPAHASRRKAGIGRGERHGQVLAQTRDWIATARTLSEALPYLQRYDGATIVIKLGGHAMGSDAAMDEFARDIVLMKQCNVNPVVVHGGGPMINEMLKRLDIHSDFVDGKRVSDAATVEVVEMVLSGRINKRIVQAINAQGGKAVGLSGKDANLMICEKDLKVERDGQQVAIDLGFVGRRSR